MDQIIALSLEDLNSLTICWNYDRENCFSLKCMDYHPLKATTINDPCPVTPELTINPIDFDLLVLY